ncbi:MAG: DUF1176 domain-containing protein [Caulobacterales bacterium]
MRTLLNAIALALILAPAAHAAGSKTVKDWTAVCDNLRTCAAFGFSGEGGEADAYVKIARTGAPTAQPRVSIVYVTGDKAPAATWTLQIGGRPIAGVGAVAAVGQESGARADLSPVAGAALIEALRNGDELEIYQAGKELTGVSLSGSAAILIWVDDQQGRVGTVTALARRGAQPASAVPAPPAPPVIVAAPPVSQAGLAKVAPASLTQSADDCNDGRADDGFDPLIARLAPGVVLWGPPCGSGAYNEVNIFFIADERDGNARRITFPEPPGSGQARDDILMNVSFDAKTQTLSSFSKGRGLGDCGSDEKWVWDGKAFQLLSDRVMDQCHGVLSDDWPSLFVARRR